MCAVLVCIEICARIKTAIHAYLPTVPFLPGLSRFFSSVDLKKRDVPFFCISELIFYLFIFSSFYLIFFLKKEKETRSHTHWRIKVRALITKTPRSGGPVKLDSMWQHRLTRPLHVQHTYYRIIFKQNPFNIISRGVQR